MRTLAKKATFLGVIAAVVAVTVGSLAFSQDVIAGHETDPSETDVSTFVPDPTNSQFPQFPIVGEMPDEESIPPAAPLNDGNDASVGGDANSLPSAGSGGYLGSDSNTLAYALMAFAIAIVMTGSVAWVSSRE